MNEKLLKRLLQKAECPELLEILSKRLKLPDLQSLLLEVYRRQVSKLTPAQLLRQYQENRFVQPAQVSAQKSIEFDRFAFSLLPKGFEVLELSPVAPLGANSIITPVDQNNALTTIRNTEVCSDSTNVLALECALRRKRAKPLDWIQLCASHRLVRTQTFNGPASFAHFRIFSLVTAGRDTGSFRFEAKALAEQIEYFLKLFEEAKQIGLTIPATSVVLTAFNEIRKPILEAFVFQPLAEKFQSVRFAFDQKRTSGRGYYSEAGFQIFAQDSQQTELLLVDGGFTDWTQKLLNNRKERLLIGGLGTERLLFCFGN